MATPIKISTVAVVPDISKCLACSQENKQRYFILDRKGEKGPAFDAIQDFFETSFLCTENSGAFVCKQCLRSIQRIHDMKMKILNTVEKVLSTTQQFQLRTCSKRVIERTPVANSKRVTRLIDNATHRTRTRLNFNQESNSIFDCDAATESYELNNTSQEQQVVYNPVILEESDHNSIQNQHDMGSMNRTSEQDPLHDISLVGSSFAPATSEVSNYLLTGLPLPSIEACSVDIGVQCDNRKLNTPPHQKRKEITMYSSIRLHNVMSPVVKCLSKGSYRKAVKLMLSSEHEKVKKQTIKGICDVIKLECDSLVNENPNLLRKNLEEDLLNFSLAEITEKMHGTVLMDVLCTAARNQKRIYDNVKVTAAALILFYSRSKFLCKFQHLVAISMYNNHLQREGHNILTKLGLTVSHQTMHSCLRKAQSAVDERMQVLKTGIEKNRWAEEVAVHLHDHNYNQGTSHVQVTADHSYNLTVSGNQQEAPILQPGYRFNMDNLDFLIKVRDMTEQHQNKSKHYVQVMAVVDRVNCEHLPDSRPIGNLFNVENYEFLPSASDHSCLRDDFIHIIAQILTEHVPAFKVFEGVYPSFFEHQYSEYMDKKSVVLPLGILDKSENKMNDMIDILEYLHQYVPNARNADDIESVDMREEQGHLRITPLGGDQLTCERVRGAHMVRLDGETPEERLEGCMAMVEDFHEKMNFLQVIMDKFYKTSSSREGGTLYQLRNVINRRNVATDVSSNYHNASSFVDIAGESHVIAAAMEFFGMQSINSDCMRIPRGAHLADMAHKKRMLHQMLGEMVDEFILNDLVRSIDAIENNEEVEDQEGDDRIHNYAAHFLTFSLIRKINLLATRSGDGNRVVRHWKYALLLYCNAHKTKYTLEAFLLLAGILALYTPRHKHQIMWNRFINLSGGRGRNLDGDYVMELLNKYAKGRVKLVGPKHSAELVMRIGKTMMFCHDIQQRLERQVRAECLSRDHTTQDTHKDRVKIVGELRKAEVFKKQPGRSHPSFQDESSVILNHIKFNEFHNWLHSKKQEYANNKLAF